MFLKINKVDGTTIRIDADAIDTYEPEDGNTVIALNNGDEILAEDCTTQLDIVMDARTLKEEIERAENEPW